jgi:hypothetical protein
MTRRVLVTLSKHSAKVNESVMKKPRERGCRNGSLDSTGRFPNRERPWSPGIEAISHHIPIKLYTYPSTL